MAPPWTRDEPVRSSEAGAGHGGTVPAAPPSTPQELPGRLAAVKVVQQQPVLSLRVHPRQAKELSTFGSFRLAASARNRAECSRYAGGVAGQSELTVNRRVSLWANIVLGPFDPVAALNEAEQPARSAYGIAAQVQPTDGFTAGPPARETLDPRTEVREEGI